MYVSFSQRSGCVRFSYNGGLCSVKPCYERFVKLIYTLYYYVAKYHEYHEVVTNRLYMCSESTSIRSESTCSETTL